MLVDPRNDVVVDYVAIIEQAVFDSAVDVSGELCSSIPASLKPAPGQMRRKIPVPRIAISKMKDHFVSRSSAFSFMCAD